MDISAVARLADDELWERTRALASQERASAAELVGHLAELDDRRLWLDHGYTSLFEYCMHALKMSEGAAYKRIRAARASRKRPELLDLLRDGRLSLAAISILHPHMDGDDATALVQRACGMRIRSLEVLLADRQPPGPVRDVVRFVARPPAPPQPAETGAVAPLFDAIVSAQQEPTPGQSGAVSKTNASVRISFTAGEEFLRLLEDAQRALRHKFPDGRLEGVLGDALKTLLAKRRRF
jgi:hypothetical protein